MYNYDPNRMNDCLALSHVPRWSIVPHIKAQSVADHTFRVLVIARELFAHMQLPMTLDDMIEILVHDAPESRSADIPTPYKRFIKEKHGVDLGGTGSGVCTWLQDHPVAPSTRNILDAADLIEAYTFIFLNGMTVHGRFVANSLKSRIDSIPGDLGAASRQVTADILSEEGRLWA